jgi:uncharacterized protein YcnI
MRLARIAVLAALAVPAVALAHAVVYPRTSARGAYEKYVLRVPNEKDAARTTRVEIQFPATVRVVSFGDVAGWRLEVARDTSGRVTAAVWTGSLPPERFIEFPFVAVNPREDTALVWPVHQTYSDGEHVGWTGPEDGDTPASVTRIGAATSGGGSTRGSQLATVALALAVVSLAVSVRKGRRTAG